MICELSTDRIKNASLISMLHDSLKASDPILLRIMWHNLREYMLSQCHYNALCIKMLCMQGYDVILLSDEDHNKSRTKEDLEEIHIQEYY